MTPSFYDLGGGSMCTAEQLNSRKKLMSTEKKSTYPAGDKQPLIEGIITFRTSLGEHVTAVQKTKYQAMRIDQLEQLFGSFRDKLSDSTAKILAKDAPKPEVDEKPGIIITPKPKSTK